MEDGWSAASIKTALNAVATSTQASTTAYIVGGSAMVLHGFKEQTPDIDLLVASIEDLEHIDQALRAGGFSITHAAEPGDGSVRGYTYYDNQRRVVDLWATKIGENLQFSSGIHSRSQPVIDGDGITFRMLSPEDIIVSKLLGERPKDVFDVETIPRADIDMEVVRAEVSAQCRLQDRQVPSLLFLDSSTGRPGNG